MNPNALESPVTDFHRSTDPGCFSQIVKQWVWKGEWQLLGSLNFYENPVRIWAGILLTGSRSHLRECVHCGQAIYFPLSSSVCEEQPSQRKRPRKTQFSPTYGLSRLPKVMFLKQRMGSCSSAAKAIT